MNESSSSLYSFVYDDDDEPLLENDLQADVPALHTGLPLPDLLCVLLLVLKVCYLCSNEFSPAGS